MNFVFYHSRIVHSYQDLPGMRQFRALYQIYGQLACPIDRSGVLKFPIRTASLFPLPRLQPMGESYEQLCNARAHQLLKEAEELDVPLCILWSGGVDSTCALVSLLKQATTAQLDRIVVLLSGGSMLEYPLFYRKFIKGRLKGDFAELFPHFLGKRNLIVSGEHNDQLFGSDVIGDIIAKYGFWTIGEPYSRELLTAFLAEKFNGDLEMVDVYVDVFERLKAAAPVPIKTNFDLFWWVNFTLKWQTVYMRMLALAKASLSNWVNLYYQPFYNTRQFQLWSMNNQDKRIKGTWASYKWPAKQIIRDFTKDEEYYRTKEKRGSLQYLVAVHPVETNFIDETFKFHTHLEPEDFYQEDNEWAIGRLSMSRASTTGNGGQCTTPMGEF